MAVTDNFNRADGGLGANWTTVSGFGPLAIVSNACRGSTGGTHNVAVYTGSGTTPADQYAQVKVTTTGAFLGTVLRHNGATNFYVCYYPASSGACTIYAWGSGSAAQLASGSTVTATVGDVVYFEAVGTTLTMKVNGVTVCTVTDSGFTGATYIGIDIYDNGSGAVDDFEGGAVAADVSVSLIGVAASPAVGTGTVYIAADVSVSLTGVAANPQVGAGTVTVDTTVAPPPEGWNFVAPWDWWPKAEEKVYLGGVAADPRIGNGTVHTLPSLRDIFARYPFPQVEVQREPKRIPPLVVHAKPPPPPMIFVHLTGWQPMSAVGTGTIRLSYDVPEDEMLVLTAMLADL